MIALVSNTGKSSHLKAVRTLIGSSKEVFIAVAFLKQSGLRELMPSIKSGLNEGVRFTIIIGRHFALTEPEAIWSLYRMFDGTNCKLYLAPLEPNKVFHPKLYIGITGQKATVLSGSANLTGGGLQNNYECSIVFQGGISELICKQSLEFFKNDLLPKSKLATRQLLKKYESFYETQKHVRKAAVSAPKVSKEEMAFEPEKLRKYLAMYKKKKGTDDLKKKIRDYESARIVLDKMADTKTLTKDEFRNYLDELTGGHPDHKQYWYSGGLSRGKNGKEGKPGIYSSWKTFIKLVQFVKLNKDKEPIYVFGRAKKILDKINFAGVNYLGEIMMTYNPERFANINNNPVRVLRYKANYNIKASPQAYTAEEYQEYCDIITEIIKDQNFMNMIEADSFFNEIYWYMKKKGFFDN